MSLNPAADVLTSPAPSAPDELSNIQLTRAVTVASGAAIVPHTPMGRITTTGVWTPALKVSSDGSQVIRGILKHAVAASGSARRGTLHVLGPYNRALVAAVADVNYTAIELAEGCFDVRIILEDVV